MAQRARARGPPGVKRRGFGHEAEDEQRGEEGAGDVAEDDGDDGGGLVAAGGARHDHVGGDGGGQAGRGEEADEDGEGWRAGGEGAGGEGDVNDSYYGVVSILSTYIYIPKSGHLMRQSLTDI